MNISLTTSMLAVALVALPVAALAQTSGNEPLSREQVRQELDSLAAIGYRENSARYNTYPDDILAAQARIDASRAAQQRPDGSAQ